MNSFRSHRGSVVFIDIDGVLLPQKAWLLPQNAAIADQLRGGQPAAEVAPKVAFDPCAVVLVNRLARICDAQLVVHSNWRHGVMSEDALRAKFIDQGFDAELLHPVFTCPMRFSSDKLSDIGDWLDDRWYDLHGEDDDSDRTEATRGDDWLILDDDNLSARGARAPQILVSTVDGFGVAEYRVAVGYFGREDHKFGVWSVSEADWATVLAAHDGNRVAAARWLFAPSSLGNNYPTRSSYLSREATEIAHRELGRYGGDLERLIEHRHNTTLDELPGRPVDSDIHP